MKRNNIFSQGSLGSPRGNTPKLRRSKFTATPTENDSFNDSKDSFQADTSKDSLYVQMELKRLENSITSCNRCSKHVESLNVLSETVASINVSREESNELRENVVSDTKTEIPEGKFEDLVGHETAKTALIQSVILPVLQPQLFHGVRSWRAILLYGPPATGKTSLARLTAAEAQVPFYAVSCSSLLSPYLGESERKIRELFKDARNNSSVGKPAITFIDEVDSITRRRTSHKDETTRRIKSELLQQLEGFSNDKNDPFVLACSNCPWDLDAAFIRRFSRRIFIDVPTSEDTVKILKKQLGPDASFDENFWAQIQRISEGYTGSDLANVATSALMHQVSEIMTCVEWEIDSGGKMLPISTESLLLGFEPIRCSWRDLPSGSIKRRKLKPEDIIQAFEQIKPTVSKKLRQTYLAY